MSRSLESQLFLPTNAITDRMREIEFNGIKVAYRRSLDGNGSLFAPLIVEFFRNRVASVGSGQRFEKAYEWCSGPGFIGFALLAAGICEKLCLADINPRALECIERTVKRNGLEDRVTYYLSDNLTAIPESERFDLVVSNPPWFYQINPAHPLYAKLRDDLRPNDPGWRLHGDFFRGVGKHLVDGGLVCMSENEVHNANVVLPGFDGVPYDIRPRPAIDDWKVMMEEGGLDYVDTLFFSTPYGFDGEMVVAAKAPHGTYRTSDLGWGRKVITRAV
jgi:hypothetical protein